MIELVLSMLMAGADPCAAVEPAPRPDASAARAYRDAASRELAAGSVETAISAYREAAANDPSDPFAREALRRLCETPPPPDPFREGVRWMDAGDYGRAAAAFHDARAGDGAPSAALLEGICRFELGQDEAARGLFEEASAYPSHRDEARFYLGLLALRAGATEEAAVLLESARANPGLDRAASDLASVARRDGRFVISLLAETGWDSNVTLAPDGNPSGPPEADGLYALSGSALYRPQGISGPYLRLGGLLQEQLRLGAYDFDGFAAGGGWQLARKDRGLVAGYDFSAWRFGGAPYLSAHRLLGSAWLRAGPAVLGASYLVQAESYAPAWSRFSGTRQRAELRVSALATARVRVSLSYGAERFGASDAVLSFVEHGPRTELRVARGRVIAGLDASVRWRMYETRDPALSARRADSYLDASLFAEWALTGPLSLRFSLLGRKALSNVPDLEYEKVLPVVGIGYTLGLSP